MCSYEKRKSGGGKPSESSLDELRKLVETFSVAADFISGLSFFTTCKSCLWPVCLPSRLFLCLSAASSPSPALSISLSDTIVIHRMAASAASVAAALEWSADAVRIDRSDLLIALATDDDAAGALRRLVERGIAVTEFAPAVGDLEQTFLDLRGGESA